MKAFTAIVAFVVSACSANQFNAPPLPSMRGVLAMTHFYCEEGPVAFYREDTFRSPNFEEVKAHEMEHVHQMSAGETCQQWNEAYMHNEEFRTRTEAQAWCATALFDAYRYGMTEADAFDRAATWFGGYEPASHAHALALIREFYRNGSCH